MILIYFLFCVFLISCSQFYQKSNEEVLKHFTEIASDFIELDEQLSGIVYDWVQPWEYSEQYELIGMKRSWDEKQPQEKMLGYHDLIDMLMFDVEIGRMEDISLNCYNVAFDAYNSFNMSLNPPYYLSSDVPTWEKKFDEGEYNKKIDFSFEFNTNDTGMEEHHVIRYVADSLMRVDVEPREWYTKAFPFLMKNGRSRGEYGCKKGDFIKDCYFGPGGMWTAITSGFLVVSDCQINITTTDMQGKFISSGSTSCAPAYPNLAAWVIRKMPVRDSFCPCVKQEHEFTEFCTTPPKKNNFKNYDFGGVKIV